MAQRDKSQGFGFIYADLKTLMNQREEFKKMDAEWEQPVATPETSQIVNLNRDVAQDAVVELSENAPSSQANVEQIKANLDRLAKLHQKLHVMLDEINRMNPKKPSN